jgi:hypothetical protein
MSEAMVPRVNQSARPPFGATIWFVWVVAMWGGFFALVVADRLDNVWHWARDLPLLVELVMWLLTFPWLLGTAVWESSWAPWLRVGLVASFAIGWTLISIPRARMEGAN